MLRHLVPIPCVVCVHTAGKTREEVKATLKSERAKLPRRRLTNKRRTSRFLGVGSSNRKHQWQARILYHGKVTHLGYYRTEEEAARVYDKVAISLHGAGAQTNFPIDQACILAHVSLRIYPCMTPWSNCCAHKR